MARMHQYVWELFLKLKILNWNRRAAFKIKTDLHLIFMTE